MHPYLFVALPLGPSAIQRLVEEIPSSEIDTVFEEDRFTVRELIAHIADWEPLFRGRMEAAYSEVNPAIVTYDEGQRAIDLDYANSDLAANLEIYINERQKTIEFLKSLKPDEFRRSYVHPSLGTMVIEDQANFLLGHDMYHAEQLLSYVQAAKK